MHGLDERIKGFLVILLNDLGDITHFPTIQITVSTNGRRTLSHLPSGVAGVNLLGGVILRSTWTITQSRVMEIHCVHDS